MTENAAESTGEELAFTVDTHLLRELGSLLVGRDSTALVELIKNAYDADATSVIIHGEDLNNRGSIIVRDDGHGMTYDDFANKFLRIAGRSKEIGDRRSPEYERKYTGAKGIGRLAAHKLGSKLTLESSPTSDPTDLPASGVSAKIDWESLDANEASIEQAKDIRAIRTYTRPGAPHGTLLTINRLHSAWTPRQLGSFLAEVRSTRPDPALHEGLGTSVLPGALLMPSIAIADTGPADPGFHLDLSGDFAGSESQWPTLLAHLNWVVEVDAREAHEVRYRISPTATTVAKFPQAAARDFTWTRKAQGPRFAARVFIRGGMGANAPGLPTLLDRFAREASGIRVFYEGFRVLPYGSARNDWLGLEEAASRRQALDHLDEFGDELPPAAGDERTYQARNANHYGAVFLHDEASAGLQMVVNREGFLPNEQFEAVVEIMRRGLNLGVRVRAALGIDASLDRKKKKEEERRKTVEAALAQIQPTEDTPPAAPAQTPHERLAAILSAGRDAAADLRNTPSTAVPTQSTLLIEAALEEARSAVDRTRDEQSQLRVLASLGTQVGAFVHEVNGLLGQARVVRDSIDRLLNEGTEPQGNIGRWRSVSRAQNELVAALERQAVYLSDSIGAEARRRRVRMNPRNAWATATRLLGDAASRRGVALSAELPANLKLRPMFPAELNVIFTNLLSNAIKAAAKGDDSAERRIEVTATPTERGVSVVMENTGERVDLAEGERWFRPFESSTSEVDAALGQGLGLGLPLTRRIVEEYGGTISFVEPTPGMASAVEFVIPNQ